MSDIFISYKKEDCSKVKKIAEALQQQGWSVFWDPTIVAIAGQAIEGLDSRVRKAVQLRGHFPSDEAATKLIWLVLRNVAAKWKMPPIIWHQVKTQFAIHFGDRFIVTDN